MFFVLVGLKGLQCGCASSHSTICSFFQGFTNSNLTISCFLFSVTAEVVAGSAAWLGRGLSCVCAQRRESDARPSFDLTPAQVTCLQLDKLDLFIIICF